MSFFVTLLSRHFSSSAKDLPRSLSNIHSKYRVKAIQHAQKALTDYLHATRSLPFTYAENIAKNSIISLSDIVSKIDYAPSTFPKSFQKLLRYHPINEFEFFYESIGITHNRIREFVPANSYFFSDDGAALNVAFVLSEFGFPWNKLGLMCKEDSPVSLFGEDPKVLNDRLCKLKCVGFNNATVIGICLAFPNMLIGKCELDGEVDALFDDLKRVFLDFNLMNCVEENVDSFYDVCMKIRAFYDMGCEKGKIGELLGKNKSILIEYSEEILLKKFDFFLRIDVAKEDVGWLILRFPEILSFDLETPMISLLGFLKHFGMSALDLRSVCNRYPYLLGNNKMENLPHVIRALDLHEWFFDEIKNGNHRLLHNYVIKDPNEDVDEEFTVGLERIHSSPYRVHTLLKLDFMHRVGFGENGWTLRILKHLHGTSSELQERFDCLLYMGVDYSKLCRIISLSPKILNQKSETLRRKVKFLCEEMGASLQYLDVFPALLNFDLDNRIKPRFRFHMWLTEKGLCTTRYSIASVVATSEKNFIARISGIHPAAPKQWFECFSYKKPKTCSPPP